MPASNDPSTVDVDVLIIGAGPIGLATACALRHHGVPCRIIEERTEPKENSRANNFWARPQELLASIGVLDALAEKSYRIEHVNTVLNGQPIAAVEVDQVASPYPKVLYSGQDIIETTLTDIVAERGSLVECGLKATGLTQDDDGVTVAYTEADDAEGAAPRTLRCRYLVGADGGEGMVCKALGLDFEKERFEGRANRQIDCRLHWRRSTDSDQLWFFYYHNGFCGVMPGWGGYHRLFFLADGAGVPDRDPTLEEMQTLARSVTEDDTLTLADPIWLSMSRFQHGVSPGYAKGRVFKVGDAGHATLPIGGQGMNAGFHDAVGIAWRLAMTLQDRAEPVVLDSYDGERGGEHVQLDDQQAKGFRQVVYRNWLTDAALNLAAKVVPDLGSRIQGTDDLQQLSVGYPKSPLNDDQIGLRQLLRADVPQAGDRAPDADVTVEGGETTTLFSHIYNPDGRSWGWALLAFDGGRDDALPDLLAATSAVKAWDWLRPRLILASATLPAERVGAPPVMSDLAILAHSAYGLEGIPALVLVRPDGHIAFRGPADHPERLRTYCETVVGPSVAAAA